MSERDDRAGGPGGHMPVSSQRASRQPAIGPAPGRLELVRAFVNTLDIEAGTDEFSSPAALMSWLAERELVGPPEPPEPSEPAEPAESPEPAGPPEPAGRSAGAAAAAPPRSGAATDDDLRRAVALREALREVIRAHVT